MRVQISFRLLAALSIALSLVSVSSAGNIQFATVPVGSPGNAADPATGFGAVAYNYNIGEFDVTNAQYVAFLNAKASASDPNTLWAPAMGDAGFGGITRSGSGPFTYTVTPGYANKPAQGVSWFDAARFVNWLQNGQGNGDTESGTYTFTPVQTGTNVAIPSDAQRAAWAASGQFHWLLPSQAEWYKAAYYNPATSLYYKYPFQSNTLPSAVAPPGSSNSGNFSNAALNYDGTDSYITNVGAYPNAASPFGAYDMGGDVWQFDDTGSSSGVFGIHGSNAVTSPNLAASTFQASSVPEVDNDAFGFRIAFVGVLVPEPSSFVLACCGLAALVVARGWCRRSPSGSSSFVAHRRLPIYPDASTV